MLRRIALVMGVAFVLVGPAVSMAYFPPATTVNQGTPPDPFEVPGLGGLGEPEVPDPDKNPTVATPEPATIVTALMGVAVAAGYRWRKRRQQTA